MIVFVLSGIQIWFIWCLQTTTTFILHPLYKLSWFWIWKRWFQHSWMCRGFQMILTKDQICKNVIQYWENTLKQDAVAFLSIGWMTIKPWSSSFCFYLTGMWNRNFFFFLILLSKTSGKGALCSFGKRKTQKCNIYQNNKVITQEWTHLFGEYDIKYSIKVWGNYLFSRVNQLIQSFLPQNYKVHL